MVVPAPNSAAAVAGLPTIDFSATSDRRVLSKLIVEACENFGFFKLINHGIPQDAISRVEEEAAAFFAMSTAEKIAVGPKIYPAATSSGGETTRFGYGFKNIGRSGDMGEIEYLLFSAQQSSISENPSKFSCAVNDYIDAVKNVACELLDLTAEGLGISDKTIFSRMISDVENDSLFRINHYRPLLPDFIDLPPSKKMGFGEHSDPQIFTILRSNDVAGLQILLDDGLWVPISPDPTAYYIMVGDLFQVLTNGRFVSLKHRAAENTGPKPRMSIAYFASPSLDQLIYPLQDLVTSDQPSLYKSFTWGQYKAHIYSSPLAYSKLDSFKIETVIS